MKILIVEDDVLIGDSIAGVFEFESAYVHHVTDGGAALIWLAHNPPPSVILLDLMMPKMDGYEFLRHKAQLEAIAWIPVVIMTAQVKARLQLDGYTDIHRILYKPFKTEQLEEAIQSVTPRHMETTSIESPSPALLARVKRKKPPE